MQKGLSERDCNACLEVQLSICNLHPALTQKIDISKSTAVIQYVERLHMTGSFRVMSVNTHRMLYQKVVAMRVWIHNSLIISHIQL